jgi:hypothetical protein
VIISVLGALMHVNVSPRGRRQNLWKEEAKGEEREGGTEKQ